MTSQASKRPRDNQGGLLRTEIRARLREHADGLTLKQLIGMVKGKSHSVYRAIKRMPDAYVSHWVEPNGEKQQAVFRVVPVPADCPRPPMSRKSDDARRAYQREYRATKKAEAVGLARSPSPSAQRVTHMSADEAARRDRAMLERYSNPPTYKAIK